MVSSSVEYNKGQTFHKSYSVDYACQKYPAKGQHGPVQSERPVDYPCPLKKYGLWSGLQKNQEVLAPIEKREVASRFDNYANFIIIMGYFVNAW